MRDDRELWSNDIEWYLTQRDAACGVRSSLGGQVATIERGVSASGAPNSDPYDDGQVGLGPAQRKAFARDREMRKRWHRLPESARAVLRVHYGALAPSDPATTPLIRWSVELGPAILRRAEGQLGKLVRVTLWLGKESGKLTEWAKAWGNGSSAKASTVRAERTIRDAHRAYYRVETEEWLQAETEARGI